ncbi:MAG: hypothetical protein KDE08_04210 [Rhodobacteraceae bacterium]|nr:hypothetical protein [Paracoccaceae bacterium]
MRIIWSSATVILLAACQPPVPYEPVGGVGFGNYSDYQRQQAAAAAAARVPVVPNTAPVHQIPGQPAAAPVTGSPIVSAPISQPLPSAVVPQTATPAPAPAVSAGQATPQPVANAGISDEQDFSAVAARETIQSDKQRIDQNKAQFQQIAPKALPNRSGSSAGPDIIAYAISAPNRLGEPMYKRSRIALASHERACARFATPEDAQAAFLKSGGPNRDPKNLDPDGDGFACFWDPTPFQKVRG